MGCCNDSREFLEIEENFDSIETYYILVNEKLMGLKNRFGYYKKILQLTKDQKMKMNLKKQMKMKKKLKQEVLDFF